MAKETVLLLNSKGVGLSIDLKFLAIFYFYFYFFFLGEGGMRSVSKQ